MKRRAIYRIKKRLTGFMRQKPEERIMMKEQALQFSVCERLEESDMPNRIRAIGQQLTKDPEAAKTMLFKTGMYHRDGKLKKEFR